MSSTQNQSKSIFYHWWEIFLTASKLGWTSFGGPTAHIGYFRREYVEGKRWIQADTFQELVSLCQLLPGPASSQLGISIGYLRGGYIGSFLSWLGFTFPSVFLLILFAQFLSSTNQPWIQSVTHGFLIVAVAVVAQAVWGMFQSFADTKEKASLAIISTITLLLIPSQWTQIIVLILGMIYGLIRFRSTEQPATTITLQNKIGKHGSFEVHKSWHGWAFISLFFILLFTLPILANSVQNPFIDLFAITYQAGSLVFGGGHVVLPLLQEGFTTYFPQLSTERFLTGYGAAQAVPGPLFTLTAYLGMITSGLLGAIVATIGIFLPAFLLIYAVLPFWKKWREWRAARAIITGINAAVIGILASVLYYPIWTEAIHDVRDVALLAFVILILWIWKWAPWKVVLFAGALNWLINLKIGLF